MRSILQDIYSFRMWSFSFPRNGLTTLYYTTLHPRFCKTVFYDYLTQTYFLERQMNKIIVIGVHSIFVLIHFII